ncbi:MBL fold metallo-hydrolase [[Eubacterium] cellulosolvens]
MAEYYFEQLNPHSCKSYILGHNKAQVAIVDPLLDHLNDYLKHLRQKKLQLTHIFETHTHADHISGAASLRDHTDAELVMHHKAPAKCVTIRAKEGEDFSIEGIPITTIETPGHTQDSMTLILPDKILTGDTLFLDEGGAGRDDLPGGDPGAHWESLQKLLKLSENLIVYPAHDYRNRQPSSLKNQKTTNPHLHPRSKTEFINYINDLKLGPAEWMKDVLKVNYACARDPHATWVPVDAPTCEVKGNLQKSVNDQEITSINAETLEQKLMAPNRPFLLDVRESAELQGELGQIEGVINIPITNLTAKTETLSHLKDKEIVLICRSGGRASTAAQILKQTGFKKPVVLEGGMLAWRQHNS